ncbi:hypothetical protein BGW38_010894 [Lunasporangiospora selenospora]|uniref:Transcription factor CBF/NF-Y/archaeal histone domain-containing protein n=1 Tax=Lunasporangiospora selenospora TaxID=979761 RepID=A0A9P6KF81_9FUNG|nr:hypothetical protein BGW38_010894 [Lunasporangiospora selenospora]
MPPKKSTASTGRVQKKAPKKSGASTSASASASLANTVTSAYFSGEVKGATQLPVARIKRIVKEDADVSMVSNDAVFLISMATELFLASFANKAYNIAKLEKRKAVSYKDLATAVSRYEWLEFLQDVVPRTMPLSAAIEKQKVAKEKAEQVETEDPEDEGQDQGQNESSNDSSDDEGDKEEDGEEEEEEDGQESNGEAESRSLTGASSSRPDSDDELSEPEGMDED